MSKYDSNNIMECFKMSVDLKKVKEIEEYIKNLEEENNRLKEQKKELRNWLEENWKQSQDIWYVKILNKIDEIEVRWW